MLRIEELTKHYNGSDVLSNINLEIADGDFIILTGRSGGGKTTLLSIVGGLTRPDKGRVIIDDTDIQQISEQELAKLRNQKMGFVFQFPSLIPTLTVLDNLLLPIAFADRNPNMKDRAYAEELMEMVGISDRKGHYPSQLSGGQQRRVALARAMINRPSLILADEPTGDLDEKSEASIMGLFQNFNKQGVTIFMGTHALSYVTYGTTFTLKQGQLVRYEAAEVASIPVV